MTCAHLCLYRGARDPVPIAQDDFADWAELADSLEDLLAREYRAKIDMLAFAPHRLRTPYRELANVEHVTLLVLDVDRDVDVDALADALAQHAPALMYESPSSAPEARRVRIVAPVSRPIAVDECWHTRLAFAEALGLTPTHGGGVEGAKDAAKLFFIGRLAGTAPREVWRWDK